MKNAVRKKSTAKKVVKKTTGKALVFPVVKGAEVTAKQVHDWIAQHADGQLNNVVVTPLENCRLKDQKPTPFGYSRAGGVRAMYHDFHLFGLKQGHGKTGDRRLGNILAAMRKVDGHSAQTMICTIALLNGGYSPSAKAWLQGPWVQLSVAKNN